MRSSSWLLVSILAAAACSDDKSGPDDDVDDAVARPLTIAQTTPAADATNVALGATTIVVTFSEALDAATVPATLTVSAGDAAVTEVHAVDGSNLSVTFTTGTYGTRCTLTIPAGLRGTLGAELADDYTLAFSTAAPPVITETQLVTGTDVGGSTRRTVAINAGGDIAAISSSAGSNVIMRYKPSNGVWSPLTPINQGIAPSVAISDTGAAMVVANRSVTVSEYRNFSRRYANGVVGVNAQIATTGDTQEPADLVMRANGSAMVAFRSTTTLSDLDSVRFSKHDSANWLALPVLVENDVVVVREPRVVSDAAGNAHILWSSATSGVAQVRTSYCASAGGCTSPIALDTTSEAAYAIDIATNDSGLTLALWSEGAAATLRYWLSSATGSTWATPAPLEGAGSTVGSGKLAVCGSGSAFVVYVKQDESTGRNDIWASRFTNGTLSAAERLEDSLFDAFLPRVVCDSVGNATVAWLQESDGVTSVWTNRYSGNGWRGAVVAEDHDAIVDTIDLAGNASGQVVLWWLEHTGATKSVWVGSAP